MIRNLTVGQVFKNYKALCEFLGEAVKTGKSKQLQVKDWERFFVSHKEGNKIIIDEIYETPLEKVDGRSTNTFKEGTRYTQESFYKEYLKELIIDSLSKLRKDEVDFQGSMYKMLGKQKIFTKYFFRENSNPLIKQYLLNVGSKIYKPFQSALEELQEENKIKYARVTLYRFEDGEEDLLPDYLVPFYEKAYAYAEKKTRLIPFKMYSFSLSNVTAFRAELIKYMNDHKKGLYDKDIVNISNPYIIEKGAKFESCLMPLENKLKLIDNIHNQVVASRSLREKIDMLEVKSFGKDKRAFVMRMLEDCYKELYYTEEIKQAIKTRKAKEERMARIEKEIKFHAVHSDKHIALQKITTLNEEYFTLTKEDCIEADKFFSKIAEDEYLRELERMEEEIEESTTFIIPNKVLEAKEEAEMSYMIEHAIYVCGDYEAYYEN